jgi:hypothetical protein
MTPIQVPRELFHLPLHRNPLGFVHVSEATEIGPEGVRFRILTGMTDTFLPHRKLVMQQFLTAP